MLQTFFYPLPMQIFLFDNILLVHSATNQIGKYPTCRSSNLRKNLSTWPTMLHTARVGPGRHHEWDLHIKMCTTTTMGAAIYDQNLSVCTSC